MGAYALLLLFLVVSSVTPTPQVQSQLRDETHALSFGHKLNRSKPRKLDVQLALPNHDEDHDKSQEVDEIPSSTLAPQSLGKTKRGRIPSKIMVRTYKTTTTTSLPYVPEEITTTTSTPQVQHSQSVQEFYNHYYNPYVSRKPSVPPKKFLRTSTTTPSSYTFPPFSSKIHSTSSFKEEVVIPSKNKALPAKKIKYVSHVKVTPAIDSAPTKRPRVITTTTPITTTTEEYTTYPVESVGETESVSYAEEAGEGETTAPVETLSSSTTPTPETRPTFRVFTKTFRPVAKPAPQSDDEEVNSTTTTTIHSTEETPTSTTSKKVHYIITVIDPPHGSNSTVTPPPSPSSPSPTTQEEEVEEEEEYEEDSSPVIIPTEKPVDPYANFRTLDFSLRDDSPSYDFIPSVGNSNNNQNFPRFPLLPPSPPQQDFFQRQESYQRHYDQSFQQQQNDYIPLRAVNSYAPETRNKGNSPFLTSRTVLYYTSVSPANPKNIPASINSLIPPPSSPFDNLPSVVTSAALGDAPRPRVSEFKDLSGVGVAAQSYYVDQDSQGDERGLRTVPVMVDYVPN